MTMQGVYNDGTKDVLRPVKVNSSGELLTAAGTGATGLTDTQLRASPVNVNAAIRNVLGTAVTASVATSSVTLASLLGGTIPSGTLAVEVQAQGGSVRMRRDGNAPTSTDGYLIYDGTEKLIDSNLSNVRFFALGASTFLNITCFDKV